ncbi:putative retrograde regulation protein [Zalerion maritima]|uniref:Retrograde regulation protein n=1 Tax=Zalerion maritima TaxID=339359 RepID=A0AAD5WW11_9PEZI|nr:putative retrograde regulation protein [Zalerion maritima]
MESLTMDKSAVDVIRIENFASTMPKWDPESKNQRYAVVDMGSNGIRFSITCLAPPRTRLLQCLYRERAPISLFDALSSSSDFRFPQHVIASVAQALARFLKIAKDHDVPFHHISVFATEAMRKANNAVDMLKAIHDATTLKVHVLDGTVETLFGAAGARSAFSKLKGLVLDLGGGSVQMTWMDSTVGSGAACEFEGVVTGDDERRVENAGQDSVELEEYEVAAARAGRSMPFGAARMTGVLESGDNEAIKAAKTDLHSQMRESFIILTREFQALREMVEGLRDQSEGLDIHLCGGGFRGYGSMLMHSESVNDTPYPFSSIGSYRVGGEAFSNIKKMMSLHEEAGDAKIFGLSKRRRRQFPAIIAVVEALLAAVHPAPIRSATFCAGSNREGALFMMLPREVRETNPLPLIAPKASLVDMKITEDVIRLLTSATPRELVGDSTPTIFSLGLAPMFVQTIWSRPGGDAEYNAAALLHEAVAGNEVAGMTHIARAVLALTSAARWEGVRAKDFGPVERQLWKGLKGVTGEEASFWCVFVGTVGMCVSTVVSAWPKGEINRSVRFAVAVESGKKHDKVVLVMQVEKDSAVGLNLDTLGGAFEKVKIENDDEKRGKKVKFSVQIV